MSPVRYLLLFALVGIALSERSAANPFSTRIVLKGGSKYAHPYSSVGLVQTRVGKGYWRGSAAVARNPSLLYSCAHLVYDVRKGWASRFAFRLAYDGPRAPSKKSYVIARGYRVLSGYAPNEEFDYDFAVAYGGANRKFGPVLAIHDNPLAAVTDPFSSKLILGYPADLDHVWQANTGRYYMYQTGPFTTPYIDDDNQPGGHYTADWTTTGSGNSGGPLVVWDGSSYKLAGILVSGSNYYDRVWWSGVYALGRESDLVAQDALGRSTFGAYTTRSNRQGSWLKDASSKYTRRKLTFKKIPTQTTQVWLRLYIYTPRQGDIDAFVRSPKGRVRVVARRDATNTQTDLMLDADITSGFRNGIHNSNPNGVWQVFFRDALPGGRSWYGGADLSVRSRWSL